MALCLAGMTSSAVFAQEAAVVEEVAAVAEVAVMTLTGKITNIDLEMSLVTVEQTVGETVEVVILSVNDLTNIERFEETIKLSDLVVGDNISVKYNADVDGKLVAQNIRIE